MKIIIERSYDFLTMQSLPTFCPQILGTIGCADDYRPSNSLSNKRIVIESN